MSNLETLNAQLTTARAALVDAEESAANMQQAEHNIRASLHVCIEQGVQARNRRAQAVAAVEAIERDIAALNAN